MQSVISLKWSDVKVAQSCPTLCDPMDSIVYGVLQVRTWSGSLSLLQRSFPTQGLNPGLPHCRRILYQLSHKGKPRTLEWAAYPFSSRFSWPRTRTWVSGIAGGFFTNWAIREAPHWLIQNFIWHITHTCTHMDESFLEHLEKIRRAQVYCGVCLPRYSLCVWCVNEVNMNRPCEYFTM